MADDQQPRDALGTHRGGARHALEQRDLAEEVAGPERRDRRVTVEDHQPAIEDDEELVAGLALLGEELVEADLDLVGQLAQALELTAAQRARRAGRACRCSSFSSATMRASLR